MQDVLGESLRKIRKNRARKARMIAIALVLSLVVSLDVFWCLRQPGLTLAGDGDCGITEHTHDENCQGGDTPCALPEHVHELSCYADPTADTETQLDWQKMFAGYPYTGDLQKDLAGIARTQAGYRESTRNFRVGDDGIRRGYTRYGAWYGAPYTDWSAAFVSFCLHYAGADPSQYPGNTGAASMAEAWKRLDKFVPAGGYAPSAGDLIFFTNNTVGIVTQVQNATCYMICGDVDNGVCTVTVPLSDETVLGWGLTGTVQTEPPPAVPDITDGPVFLITEGSRRRPTALEAPGPSQTCSPIWKQTAAAISSPCWTSTMWSCPRTKTATTSPKQTKATS